VFGSGINLTQLYRGQIPFLWFLQRDMGFVHKFLRGVARPEELPDDVHGHGIEKPWIAALDGFAIGGHCQVLLTMDYVRGQKVTSLSPLARLDIKGAPLAEELFRAYLKQVLIDGLFHADPHLEQLMREAQDFVCSLVPPGRSLANELIEERRRESEAE